MTTPVHGNHPSEYFNGYGPIPYFFPPERRDAAKKWLKDNGHKGNLASDVIDLYGRWYHNQNQSFSDRRLQEIYEYGRKGTDILVDAVIALAGLRRVDHTGPTGKVQGFHLERKVVSQRCDDTLTSPDQHLPPIGRNTDKSGANPGNASASVGTQVRLQEHQVRPQEHQVRPQEHTNKEVNKESNKEFNKEEELSPPLRVEQDDRTKRFLKLACRAGLDQQLRLGRKGNDGFDMGSISTYLDIVAGQQLTFDDVVSRVCNCFSWAASQHWIHRRPLPADKTMAQSLGAHLKGDYPCSPTEDDKLHSEDLCSVDFSEQQGFVLSVCDGSVAGLVGKWGDITSEQPLTGVTADSVNPACSAPAVAPETLIKTLHETHASHRGYDTAATERAKHKILSAFKDKQPTAA